MVLGIEIAGGVGLDLGDCPDFSFSKSSPGGDQNATVNLPFTRGMTLPRADREFTIVLDGIPIWGGFTGPLEAPELSECAGQASIGALGWALAGPKRGEGTRIYGPRWVEAVLGDPLFGIEGAVKEAVSQLAPDWVLQNDNVLSTGVLLQETENFQGQAAAEVLNNLAARTQYLATPAIWHVRQRVFEWRSMDLAPRYQALMANGAKVKPKYDPARVVNRVIIGWGNNTPAIWPQEIDYTKRRQIVDLYLNAGAEVRDYPTALGLAKGVYARQYLLSPEWSLDITIPRSCPVEELIDSAWVEIPTVLMEPGHWIRIPDLDPGSLGPELEVPQGGWMTRVGWQNKASAMSVSVGEPRSSGTLTRLARKVVTQGVSPLNIWGYTGRDFSVPARDAAGKMKLLGPPLVEVVQQNKPPPVDYQIPAVSTEHKTVLPETLPPLPPTFGFQINTPDVLGPKGVTSVEPQVLTKWSLNASKPCTVTVKVTRVSDGAVIIPAATLVAQKRRLEVLIVPEFPLIAPDHIEYEITLADPTMVSPDATSGADNYVAIDFRARRYFPEYPGDPSPKTGKQF